MSKQVEFGEIDFGAIEYRNEYRHTKSVFACLAVQAYSSSTFLKWLFEGDLWLALLGGAYLGLIVFLIAYLFIQYRSRVIITGQSLILKRPLFKDVEIAYWEVGEVQVNGMVIRESYDDDSGAIDLSAARRRWPAARHSMLKLWSRDRKRKITVRQSLESFDRFCDDLAERWRSAIDRYLGYAKGTSLRQPERHLKTQETLKAQKEEALLKASPPSGIRKTGAGKSE
jgi:hypothetical protein